MAKVSGSNIDVKERDNYQCQYCGADMTDVHHIEPRSSFGKASKKEQEEARNKICVCKKHHREIETGKLVVVYFLHDTERPVIVNRTDYEMLLYNKLIVD